MPRRIPGGGPTDGRILEPGDRIALDPVPPIDPLSTKHGIRVRTVIVGDVNLVEPSAIARNRERRAAHVDAVPTGFHPERRIAGAEQELSGRRRRDPTAHDVRWRPGGSAPEHQAAGDNDQDVTHRSKIQSRSLSTKYYIVRPFYYPSMTRVALSFKIGRAHALRPQATAPTAPAG